MENCQVAASRHFPSKMMPEPSRNRVRSQCTLRYSDGVQHSTEFESTADGLRHHIESRSLPCEPAELRRRHWGIEPGSHCRTFVPHTWMSLPSSSPSKRCRCS